MHWHTRVHVHYTNTHLHICVPGIKLFVIVRAWICDNANICSLLTPNFRQALVWAFSGTHHHLGNALCNCVSVARMIGEYVHCWNAYAIELAIVGLTDPHHARRLSNSFLCCSNFLFYFCVYTRCCWSVYWYFFGWALSLSGEWRAAL